jgi:hypothetical protein
MAKKSIRWFLVGILILYGGYTIWLANESRYWLYWCWGAVSLAGGVGLALRRRWSQYPVYLLALATVASWGYGTYSVWTKGWPYHDTVSSVISLLPGALLVALCFAGAWFVYSFFRNQKEQA